MAAAPPGTDRGHSHRALAALSCLSCVDLACLHMKLDAVFAALVFQ